MERDVERDGPFAPEYGEPQDPIPENPFDPKDGRFETWREATKEIETGIRQGVADAFRRQQLASTTVEKNHWRMVRVITEFDAWAGRSACLVWSDKEQKEFSAWIATLANSAYRYAVAYLEGTPIERQTGAEVFEDRLGVQVLHWKGVAARCLAERVQFLRSQAPVEREKPRTTVGGPKLAKWLKRRKDEHPEQPLALQRFSDLSGIDRGTIKRILKGEKVRRETLAKLAKGLGVQVNDIPTT